MPLHPSAPGTFRPTTTPVPRDDKIIKPPTDGPRDFRVGVEFPAHMTVGVMQTIRVEVAPLRPLDRVVDLGRSLVSEPLPVRLVMPGALVSPPEQGVEPSPFEPVQALFHVTPLATGDLPQARMELLRGSSLDAIDIPVHCQGRLTPWFLAVLTILVPLLLYLPGKFVTEIQAGVVQREVADWLPGVPLRRTIAAEMQHAATFLATTGQQGHLSFFAFLGFSSVTVWLVLTRRPSRQILFGETFSLGTSSRGNIPPNYLTPVSAPEI